MKKPFNFKTQTFSALESLAVIAQNNSLGDVIVELQALLKSPGFVGKAGWVKNINKTLEFLGDLKPVYSVYAKGNSKLPFYSFSVLPGVSCPGAGECLQFCYSPKAWRYPAAFFRQFQNSILMRFNFQEITKETAKIPKGSTVRLYVDGDFSDESDVNNWFNCMSGYPELSFYGYSKSLQLLADYNGDFPRNYKLNLSSGHNASDSVVQSVKTLPIYRGEFIAVNTGKKIRASDNGTKETNDAIRSRFTEKVFPCPGKCGECTSVSHACGSEKFKNKIIAIAVH